MKKLLLMTIFVPALLFGTGANMQRWAEIQHSYDFGRLNIYRDPILAYAAKYAVDPYLIAAIIMVESKGNRWAVGADNDRGLMQVVPKWHMKDLTVQQWHHPWYNIDRGTKHLRDCINRKRNLSWAISCYNRGASGAYNRLYVNKVMFYYRDYLANY